MLCNLERLPRPLGFTVLALPIKVTAASGGWARVVALYPAGS
jgi:kynurenine formamidase